MAAIKPAHEQDNNEAEQPSKVTIVFFGDTCVGKTSLIQRFLGYGFSDEYHPTIEDFYIKHVFYQKKTCELQIIDTSGMHEFPAMRKVDILKADAFVLVYSTININSFRRLNRYRAEILEERKENRPCVVVCNKIDLEPHNSQSLPIVDNRGIQISARHLVENQWKNMWLETSAKENLQVDEIFERLLQEIFKQTENPHRKLSSLLQMRKRSAGQLKGISPCSSVESLR